MRGLRYGSHHLVIHRPMLHSKIRQYIIDFLVGPLFVQG